jgi:hypothetical protein
MTTQIHQYGPDGQLIRSETLDLVTGKVSIVEGGKTTTVDAPADLLEAARAEDREQRQLDRLDAAFTALRDGTRLTPATYRQATAPADLRPLVNEVNALRAIVLDLTRLVRNMAAEE